MINQKFFFDYIRLHLFAGKLRPSQLAGLQAILNYQTLPDDRWMAYILATVHHETDKTMQPVREYDRGRGRIYGIADKVTGHAYYGRGFVQLTWKGNYAKMSKVVGVDLVNNPDLALDMKISTQILFHGMIHGSFTGKKLSDYFNAKKEDWIGARRIINGTDKANLIAEYAKQYYAAISYVK